MKPSDKEMMDEILEEIRIGHFSTAYARSTFLRRKLTKDVSERLEKLATDFGNSGTSGDVTEAKASEMLYVLGYRYDYDKKRLEMVTFQD